MKITKLSRYKGETFEAELDGERKVYINALVVSDYGLFEGGEISEETLFEITSADDRRKAKKRALYLLGDRAYCSGELKNKLLKSYSEEIAEEAVLYVKELGYIDDEDYARKLAEYLVLNKKHGKIRAKQEMLGKGLSRELCENALSELSEEDLDEELCELIRKRYYDKISERDARRKTIAALARRGWEFSAIKRCIEAVLNEKIDEETDEYDS